MDIFKIIYKALEPYLNGVLNIVFVTTLYGVAIKVMRAKSSHGATSMTNPYTALTTAFVGYFLGKSIPISIEIIDKICVDILKNLQGGM